MAYTGGSWTARYDAPMNLFVSCCAPGDPRLRALLGAASRRALRLETSPTGGDDPRFRTWYEEDLPAALARTDQVVVVQTDGWASSTWMASELLAALGRCPGRVWFWGSGLRLPDAESAEARFLDGTLDADAVLDAIGGR